MHAVLHQGEVLHVTCIWSLLTLTSMPLQIVLALKLIEQILAQSRSHLDSHQQVRSFSQSSATVPQHAEVCTALAALLEKSNLVLLLIL